MKFDTSTTLVKCNTCNHSYKVFTVNLKVDACKNCPSGKVTKVEELQPSEAVQDLIKEYSTKL